MGNVPTYTVPEGWRHRHSEAALREGWTLLSFMDHTIVDSHAHGADIAADLVMGGEQEHHRVARQIIHRDSPAEWARLLKRVAQKGLCHGQ